jgi:hypothetical protein
MPVAQQKGSERDACKTEACSIQTCMSKNGYDISQCQHQIDKLQQCCKKHQVRPCLAHLLTMVWLEVCAFAAVDVVLPLWQLLARCACVPCN